MKYRIRITTEYTGNGAWLDDCLAALKRAYGSEFADKLCVDGRVELKSKDQDGAAAVSVYELGQTGH